MQEFKAVGDEIFKRWSALDFDEARFPEIATSALESAALHERVGLDEVANWVVGATEFPTASVSKTFSDAGFCVYYTSRFVIEVLTWLEASTAIHQHNFCGAFQVLQGESLHTEYKFVPAKRVSERLLFGSIERSSLETLPTGAVQAIEAGSDYIHRLFHLERPSISIVVRAFVQSTSPQYAYVEPGVCYDPFNRPAEIEQQFKMLSVLSAIPGPRFADHLCALIARSDQYLAFTVAHTFGPTMYERLETDALRSVFEDKFGPNAALVDGAMVAAERFNRITLMRQRVRTPEKRFFLALLLNASTKAELLEAITLRYPDQDPCDFVVALLRDMSGLAGFFEFDEAGMAFLDSALRSNSPADTIVALETDCGVGRTFENRAHLEDLDHGFRRSILEPLLS